MYQPEPYYYEDPYYYPDYPDYPNPYPQPQPNYQYDPQYEQQYDPYYEQEYEPYYEPQQFNKLSNRVYLNNYAKAPYLEEEEIKFNDYSEIDLNAPQNQPYVPIKQNDQDFEDYLHQFIANLPKMLEYQEEIIFARYLAECILLDNRIRNIQTQLRNDSRFNSRSLFDYFDSKKSNKIDFNEFQLAMNKLDIVLTSQHCNSLFLRFGGDDRKISALEFHEMLCGIVDLPTKFYSLGAQHYMHLPFANSSQQYLTVLQRNLINDLFNQYSLIEKNLDELRKILDNRNNILLALFRQIDYQNKGYIVLSNLVQYLNDLGGEFFDNDLLYNFNRISKLKCGRINFTEFCKEFGLQDQSKERNKDQSQTPSKRKVNYLAELEKSENKNEQPEIGQSRPQQQFPQQQFAQQQNQFPQQFAQQQYPSQPPQRLGEQQQMQPQQKPQKQTPQKKQHSDALFPGFTLYKLEKPQE